MINSTPSTTAKIIHESAGMRRIFTLDRLPFTLGRGSDRNLVLSHPQVSRDHARIERDADGFFLTDAGSRHGTFANGMQVTTTRLRSGDRITLGTSTDALTFEETEENSSTRSLLASLSISGSESDLETLSLFLKAAQSLNQHGALDDLLNTMLGYVIRITDAERGFVFLGDSPDQFELACGRDSNGLSISNIDDISNSIIRDAAKSQLDFVLSDTSGELGRGRESIVINAIRSVAAIPLRGRNSNSLLGLLYLDSRSGPQDFTRIGKEILHSIASQAATLLENFRMMEAERQAVLLRKELEIAASIQRQMIPQTLPQIAGLTIEGHSVPSSRVGGDFYDVIPVSDGFVAILGDVSGKGVPAALLASMAQGMFHAQITIGDSLQHAVQSLNTLVCTRAPGSRYLTLVAVHYIVSREESNIELITGGHVSPMIVRADGSVDLVEDGDMPVGLLDDATFHTIPLTLGVGDRLVLLSDGITEAEDPNGVQFSQNELAKHIALPDFVAGVFPAIDVFTQGAPAADDQTVLAITRSA